jgi:hypothetical protein
MTIDQKGNKGNKEEGSKQHPGDAQRKEEYSKQILQSSASGTRKAPSSIQDNSSKEGRRLQAAPRPH